MEPSAPGQVTRLLERVQAGDSSASDELFALVYDELRSLARRRMANARPADTLQPTALVHEAYLRLIGKDGPSWESRGGFFAAAARAMRDIVIEQARRRAALKRGGDRQRVSLDPPGHVRENPAEDLLSLNEALERLESRDRLSADVVMLRFFGGLTGDQAAAALGVSPSTVDRHWSYARAWLRREIAGQATR